MTQQNAIKLFEQKQVRSVWDDTTEEWYFSVVDVVAILTDSQDPRNYWKVLKNRLKKEGNQSVTNCNQLKLPSSDGKFYKTDVATAEQLSGLSSLFRRRKRNPLSCGSLKLRQSGSTRCRIRNAPLNRQCWITGVWAILKIGSING